VVERVPAIDQGGPVDKDEDLMADRILERNAKVVPHGTKVLGFHLAMVTRQAVNVHTWNGGNSHLEELVQDRFAVRGETDSASLWQSKPDSGEKRIYGDGQVGGLEKHYKTTGMVKLRLIYASKTCYMWFILAHANIPMLWSRVDVQMAHKTVNVV